MGSQSKQCDLDIRNEAMLIQHPFQPGIQVTFAELFGLIDHEFELIADEDRGSEHGVDVIGRENAILNRVTLELSESANKDAFIAALIDRYIGL